MWWGYPRESRDPIVREKDCSEWDSLPVVDWIRWHLGTHLVGVGYHFLHFKKGWNYNLGEKGDKSFFKKKLIAKINFEGPFYKDT